MRILPNDYDLSSSALLLLPLLLLLNEAFATIHSQSKTVLNMQKCLLWLAHTKQEEGRGGRGQAGPIPPLPEVLVRGWKRFFQYACGPFTFHHVLPNELFSSQAAERRGRREETRLMVLEGEEEEEEEQTDVWA